MNPWQVKSAFYAFMFRLPPFSWIRDREHVKIRRLFEKIDPPPDTVVDVGTGVGGGLFPVSGIRQLICIDRCFQMIRRVPGKARRLVAEAGTLPLPTHRFRVVTAVGLIEYLPDPSKFIAETARILEEGGFFLVTASPPGVWSSLRNGLGSRIYPARSDTLDTLMGAQDFSLVENDRTLMQVQSLYRWNGHSQKQE